MLQPNRALPLLLNGHDRKDRIGVIALAAVADGAAIQRPSEFERTQAIGSIPCLFGDTADLDLTFSLDEVA